MEGDKNTRLNFGEMCSFVKKGQCHQGYKHCLTFSSCVNRLRNTFCNISYFHVSCLGVQKNELELFFFFSEMLHHQSEEKNMIPSRINGSKIAQNVYCPTFGALTRN